MKNDRFESLFIPEMDIDDDHDDDASSTSSMGSYQSLGSDDGFVHSESNVNVVEQYLNGLLNSIFLKLL